MERWILVVDDDEGVRLTIKHVLEAAMHRVSLARSAAEAEQHLPDLCPDLVITDLIMPGGEGTELISKIRETAPGTRIIAMSGGARLGNPNILQEALLAGADRILAKPFQSSELTGLVAELLGLEAKASAPEARTA